MLGRNLDEAADGLSRARSTLAAEVESAVRDTVGSDSETGRAVLKSYVRPFPVPADERDVRTDENRRGGRRGW